MPRLLTALCLAASLCAQTPCPIHFTLHSIPFRLENDQTPGYNAPETMPGGVAIFDYNSDGRPDIFFVNGANIATLQKDNPKYYNRLFRNDGNGKFTDVTAAAGLKGTGYDMGVAIGDYDNDGHPDIFIAGVHGNTLYHNNGDGTFTDVTKKAGLDKWNDPQYGPLWAVAAVWVDVNNDGLLDLFVVNYLQWKYGAQPMCSFRGTADYCHPRYYKGLPDQLFLNNGDGTFKDVSAEWGLRDKVGKGMGAASADYDLDGKPDLFVTNDAEYNFLFHNTGSKFEEVAFPAGVALAEDGDFISGMGVDFRDFNNDGYPDIVFVALASQTFPLFQNTGKGDFKEVTSPSGMRALSLRHSGFGAALYDFDNDGWKDLFVTGGHVESQPINGQIVAEHNTVFRNLGRSGKWAAYTEEAGLAVNPPARHRGCAFGDLDGDGRIDVVATALSAPAEIWMNRSQLSAPGMDSAPPGKEERITPCPSCAFPKTGHWLDIALRGTKSNRDGIGARIKLVTKSGTQYNHMTTSVGYASSSDGPVHFGLGRDARADRIEIHWPSGIVQILENVPADRVIKATEPRPQQSGLP